MQIRTWQVDFLSIFVSHECCKNSCGFITHLPACYCFSLLVYYSFFCPAQGLINQCKDSPSGKRFHLHASCCCYSYLCKVQKVHQSFLCETFLHGFNLHSLQIEESWIHVSLSPKLINNSTLGLWGVLLLENLSV